MVPLRCGFLIIVSLWTANVTVECVDAADPFSRYDLMMRSRPALPQLGEVRGSTPGLTELWAKALQRDEPELKRMVIDTIKIAHQREIDV